ncbi:MAG: DUF692 domain-containing protein [Simkania sp.]|nr:DUF692 domain-containing protein [Simkania sp.]
MLKKHIPNLGIGVGLRPYHYKEILSQLPAVDWFEIISEDFMSLQGQNYGFLEKIAEHYPIVQHGTCLCIGSAVPLDFAYLKKLKALAKNTKTPWISDHLSWGNLKGMHFHDLLPLPFTEKTVNYVAERARIVQDYLEIPFALENISSYAAYKQDAMTEWEFYSAVVEKANIFMMLDVNNIYVSSRNHGFSPQDFYKNIPLDRVIQIHLAGHTVLKDCVLDTHDNYVCDAVWEIYRDVYPLTGGVSTLLEWDDRFISFNDTWKEALKAKQFQNALVENTLL